MTTLEQKEFDNAIESLEKWLRDNPSHPDREKVQRQINIKYAKLKARKDAEKRKKRGQAPSGINEVYVSHKYL
ncbi:MAG: hypothetical protein RBS19_00375 [Bacteroidales bacterium]|nr:hypothetical protein [Bacteroidales bacterium]